MRANDISPYIKKRDNENLIRGAGKELFSRAVNMLLIKTDFKGGDYKRNI